MGYFDYITSLGPQDIPDYEWLLMQLDSGGTGLAPSRMPVRRQLADWPSPGDLYSRKDYAMVSGNFSWWWRTVVPSSRYLACYHNLVSTAANCRMPCFSCCRLCSLPSLRLPVLLPRSCHMPAASALE